MNARVVITGIGICSPIGTGADEFTAGLESGCRGIGTITHYDAAGYPIAYAAEAKDGGKVFRFPPEAQMHRYPDGTMVPGTFAYENELLEIAGAVGKVGGRAMQYLGNVLDLDRDLPYTKQLAHRVKGPVHFIMSDTGWQRRLALIEAGRDEGLKFYGHVAPRAVGMIGHWRAIQHPFSEAASMQSIAGLPWPDQLARLKEPVFKSQVIAEIQAITSGFFKTYPPERLFEITDYPDYEPDPATESIAARATQTGTDPLDYAYDVMMRHDGAGMIYIPIANYRPGDFSLIRDFLQTPDILVSLADGGAHCTRVCDAATPTFMLTHWARDRTRGEKLSLEHVVRSLSHDAAQSYGLMDRGLIAEGYLADLNVIDFDHLRLPAPYRAFDFPLGGQRLLQKAEGYVATIKRGRVTFRNGEHCGVYPGQVIRGPQMAKSANN